MYTSNTFPLLAAVGMTAMFASALTNAEDKLTKDKLEYIGWQKSKTDFKTCHGKLMLVGDGVVAPTPDKCKDKSIFTVADPVDMEGKIEAVDLKSQIIKVKLSDGATKRVFVSDEAVIETSAAAVRSAVNLKNIEIGNSVKARVTDVGGDLVTNNVTVGGKR
jgi:hypothetical protein